MSNWVRGLRRFGLVAIICCFTLALSSRYAHAQSFSVTNVTKNPASKASYPAMVVDSQGNLNVAWIDSVKGLQFARSSSSANGTSFGNPPTITTIKGPNNATVFPSFQPQLAVYPTQEKEVEITWASPDPTSTPAAPVYDVWAARSKDGGGNFATTAKMIAGPVALFDSPRLAFDFSGKTNIVWGQHNVWISQAQDGLAFGPPVSLLPVTVPPTPLPDTGGPRVAVSAANHIFVAWTDEANKNATNPPSYCTSIEPPQGTPVPNTIGGNFWVNETIPGQTPSLTNTRNLSDNDWKGVNSRFPNGFFGCSYDNLSLYVDKVGLVHLLWSDDSPIEDVLSSKTQGTYPAGSPFAGETQFSFPINLASVPAASPTVTVDNKGNIYAVWSGGPTGGTGATPGSTNSQGIFFSRADAATPYTDTGNSFTAAVNIAPTAVSPAFPQIAVDSNSVVYVAWEQPTKALAGDGSDVFSVFLARSTDKGNTFPTVLPVSTNPSVFCYKAPPPPQGTGAAPTTPDVSTCGTVQLGVDASSNPDMVWVNQGSGAAIADIDFATPPTPGFSIALSVSSASVLAGGTATFNVQIAPTNGFSGSVALSCSGLPAGATCSFNPATTTSTTTTSTLTVSTQGSVAASSYTFTVTGTSGATISSKPATLVIGTITASVSPTSATIGVQSSANFTLNLSSSNGFTGNVTFACPGLPAGITCTFNPTSISVPGSTTLTVAVSAKPTGSLVQNGPHDLRFLGLQGNTALSMVFVALALILSGMIAASRRKAPVPWARGLAVMALVLVLAVGLISCSGGGSSSTTSSGGGTGGGATPFNGQISVQAQSGGGVANLSTLSITVP